MHALALALLVLAPLGLTASPLGAPRHQGRDRDFVLGHFRVGGTTRTVGQLTGKRGGWRREFGKSLSDKELLVDRSKRGLIDTVVGGLGTALAPSPTDPAVISSLSRASVRSVKSESRASASKASAASVSRESVASEHSASAASDSDHTPSPSKTASGGSATDSCSGGLLDGVLCGVSSAVDPSHTTPTDAGQTTKATPTPDPTTRDDDPTTKTGGGHTASETCSGGLLDGVLCGVSSAVDPSHTTQGGHTTEPDSPTTRDTPTGTPDSDTPTPTRTGDPATGTDSCSGGLIDGVLCGVTGGHTTDIPSGTGPTGHTGTATTTPDDIPTGSPVPGNGTTTDDGTTTGPSVTHVVTPPTTTGSADGPSTTASQSDSGTESEPQSRTTTTNDESSTTTGFGFAPSSTLLVTQLPSTTSSDSDSDSRATTSATQTTPAQVPSETPQKIVPGSTVPPQPDGTTLISILYNAELAWKWLVEISPDTTIQIFEFMPQLIASSLQIDPANVTNLALVAYVPAGYNPSADDGGGVLSVWLAYIPSDSVSALQAYVKTPTSPLYGVDMGVMQHQLADRIDPSLLITTYSTGLQGGNGDGGDGSGGSGSDGSGGSKSKTTIIAVVVSLGVVALALAGYLIYRLANKRSSAGPGPVRLADNDARADARSSRRTTGFFGGFGAFGGGATSLNRSPSASTTSSGSSLTSYSSSGGHATDAGSRGGGHPAHGRSTSVDTDDRRASWWRYSQGSAGSGNSSQNGAGGVRQRSPNQDMPIMREGPRRIQVVRSPGGGYTGISKPVLQESSLLL